MDNQELDQDYLAAMMHTAATEVFTTMLGCEITTASEAAVQVPPSEFGIISLLGLTGEWTGSGGLCCSAQCACWMASQMLFTEYPEVDAEVRDAVGEITNMIVGNFKNSISEKTGAMAMSTPTVVFGREMTTETNNGHKWIVFPFSCQDHSFRMMVQLHPMRGKPVVHHPRVERAMMAAEI